MSNVSDEHAVITIEVELVSKVTGDPTATEQEPFFGGTSAKEEENKQHDDKMDKADADRKAILDSIDEEIRTAEDEATSKALQDDVSGKNLDQFNDMMDKIQGEGINNITKFATSPEGFMENGFIKLLKKAGPYGAIAVAIITAIAAAPEMVKAVVEALGVKGAPLNQDYAYTEDEQLNQQFDRVMQFKRLTGDDPVITVLTKGFVVGDPDFVDNSLVDADISRTARVGLRDSSLGTIHGI